MDFNFINLKATGENLKKLMFEAGITVREVQNALGFSTPQAIYKWLRGDNLPTLENWGKLAKLLNVTVGDILVVESNVIDFAEAAKRLRMIPKDERILLSKLSRDIAEGNLTKEEAVKGWKKGEHIPTLDELVELSDIAGINICDLLKDETED